jgi:CRP-like cAMP-binding protein
MLHKASHTFLIDLNKSDYFGEIEFFTEEPRIITAKSREYTEVYAIHRKDFLRIAEDYITTIVTIIN